ncbi:unnamed protein product, partial [Prorocentrum cordatum]
ESIEQVVGIAQQWRNEGGQFQIAAEQMRAFPEQAKSLMVAAASSAGQGESSRAKAGANSTKGGHGEEWGEQSWTSSTWWSKVGNAADASPARQGDRDPWQQDGRDPWDQSRRSDGWKDKSSGWRDQSDGWKDRSDGWKDRSDGWKYSSWESRDWNEGKWGDQSNTEKWKNDEKPRGKDFADPEAWPGRPEFKLWRRKVMRWRQTTDVETHKHAGRIMKLLLINLQRKLEDITDDDLISDSGADKVIARLDLAFDKVGTLGLPLPDDWTEMFLEEGVGLGERCTQLMQIQMRTEDSYQGALAAIREMDVTRREHLSYQGSRACHVEQPEVVEQSFPVHVPNSADDHDAGSLLDRGDVPSLDTEGEAEICVALDKMDLYDDELKYVFNSMQEERRTTLKQNRDLKRKLEIDRQFFDRSREIEIK